MSERKETGEDDRGLDRLHLWQIQSIRDILVIGGFILLIWIGYLLRAVTVPLLIALALAYLVEPVVGRLSDHPRLSRPLVVGGMLGVLAVLAAVVVITVVPLVVFQTVDLVLDLPENVRRVSVAVEPYVSDDYRDQYQQLRRAILPPGEGEESAPADGAGEPEEPQSQPETDEERTDADDAALMEVDVDASEVDLKPLISWMRENVGSIFRTTLRTTDEALDWFLGFAGTSIYLAFLVFLIPFYFFAFSVSWPGVRRFFRQLVPVARAERIHEILNKMDAAVSGFVRGRIMISLIMGVLLAIGWGITGVPYWMLIGLITGLFCAVPYLGGVGVPVAIILLFIREMGQPVDERMAWWGILLWPSLVFAVVQLLEGYVLTPLIAGKQTNLGPVSILVAVLAGGAVMGVYGMLLAIPVAACIKILVMEVWLPRVQDWAEGRAPDILPFSRD